MLHFYGLPDYKTLIDAIRDYVLKSQNTPLIKEEELILEAKATSVSRIMAGREHDPTILLDKQSGFAKHVVLSCIVWT